MSFAWPAHSLTWFAIWKDDSGQRRTPVDAEQHYELWQADTEAATLAPLRRQLQHLDVDHFRRLSAFLGDPTWEPTNNAAERGGRTFRHGQHPHFRLRSSTTIDADLKIRAQLQLQRFCSPPPTRLAANAVCAYTGPRHGVSPLESPNANSALSAFRLKPNIPGSTRAMTSRCQQRVPCAFRGCRRSHPRGSQDLQTHEPLPSVLDSLIASISDFGSDLVDTADGWDKELGDPAADSWAPGVEVAAV